jgi:hypothetical protein
MIRRKPATRAGEQGRIAMKGRTENGFSPQLYARLAGALYLYIIAAGLFAELFARGKLVVGSDAAATAGNILGNEGVFRLGFSGELLHVTVDIMVAVLLYALLRPVDRHVSLVAALMRVACAIILAVTSLTHFAALRLLKGGDHLSTFSLEQLQQLALLTMKMHGDGYAIALLFFAFACLTLGYLVYRSGYLPKFLGVLMAIAGACYLFNSLMHFLAPALSAHLFSVLFVPIFVAEASLTLWLLVKGVDRAKWEERTRAASA